MTTLMKILCGKAWDKNYGCFHKMEDYGAKEWLHYIVIATFYCLGVILTYEKFVNFVIERYDKKAEEEYRKELERVRNKVETDEEEDA